MNIVQEYTKKLKEKNYNEINKLAFYVTKYATLNVHSCS